MSRTVVFGLFLIAVLLACFTILVLTSGSSPKVQVLFPQEISLLLRDLVRALSILCLIPCAKFASTAVRNLRTAPQQSVAPAVKAVAIYIGSRCLPLVAALVFRTAFGVG